MQNYLFFRKAVYVYDATETAHEEGRDRMEGLALSIVISYYYRVRTKGSTIHDQTRTQMNIKQNTHDNKNKRTYRQKPGYSGTHKGRYESTQIVSIVLSISSLV